jgi:hypothetical protein
MFAGLPLYAGIAIDAGNKPGNRKQSLPFKSLPSNVHSLYLALGTSLGLLVMNKRAPEQAKILNSIKKDKIMVTTQYLNVGKQKIP